MRLSWWRRKLQSSLVGEGDLPENGLAHLFGLDPSGNQLTGCVPHGLVAVEDNDLAALGLAICDDS